MADQCGHRIMAITSAFQADDVGSIPTARSRKSFSACEDGITRSGWKVHQKGAFGFDTHYRSLQGLSECALRCDVTVGKDRHPFLALVNHRGFFILVVQVSIAGGIQFLMA